MSIHLFVHEVITSNREDFLEFSSRLSRNSETNASELLENLEEVFAIFC